MSFVYSYTNPEQNKFHIFEHEVAIDTMNIIAVAPDIERARQIVEALRMLEERLEPFRE